MKNVKTAFVITVAAFVGTAWFTVAQAQTITTLTKLHASYEKQGRRAVGMPEYGQQVKFSGVVLEASESMDGSSLIRAADAGGKKELARLTPADDAQNEKIASLQRGAKFTATCEVGFAMGSAYLTMTDCVIQP